MVQYGWSGDSVWFLCFFTICVYGGYVCDVSEGGGVVIEGVLSFWICIALHCIAVLRW
jgi:hypothetical protein